MTKGINNAGQPQNIPAKERELEIFPIPIGLTRVRLISIFRLFLRLDEMEAKTHKIIKFKKYQNTNMRRLNKINIVLLRSISYCQFKHGKKFKKNFYTFLDV